MTNPLVSVMLPTYNQVEFVRESIMSVVEQDYDNLEIVVSDDGSTDGTVEVILECAKKYPDRVKPLIHEQNLGITANCNRNLRACRGEYVAFTAGDDVFLPGKITKQVTWFKEDERRVLSGHDVDIFDSDTGQTIKIFRADPSLRHGRGASKWVRYGGLFTTPSIMVRASALPAYRYDERLPIVSDLKLWIDCLASGGEYGYINDVYGRYRQHNRNVSADIHTFRAQMLDRLMISAIVAVDYPHLVSEAMSYQRDTLYDLGKWYMANEQNHLAKIYFLAALRWPLGRKKHFAFAGVFLTLFPKIFRDFILTNLPVPFIGYKHNDRQTSS